TVTLGAALEPQAVRFWVQDQGPGLPPEKAAQLFQRFARGTGEHAPARAGSTGLGLYFVRLVAEKHGGSAGVESVPGHGATFWVELPRQD
ncbi:MAG: sensor histidine kinase, partial [Thiomonas sp.]